MYKGITPQAKQLDKRVAWIGIKPVVKGSTQHSVVISSTLVIHMLDINAGYST